jgi:hypothetical protein
VLAENNNVSDKGSNGHPFSGSTYWPLADTYKKNGHEPINFMAVFDEGHTI